MTSIHLVKVYESLDSSGSDRVIGWYHSHSNAVEGLHNFGSECRWSFAVIEEMGAGMHGETISASWFRFDDNFNDWVDLPIDTTSDFMRCINHTIG